MGPLRAVGFDLDLAQAVPLGGPVAVCRHSAGPGPHRLRAGTCSDACVPNSPAACPAVTPCECGGTISRARPPHMPADSDEIEPEDLKPFIGRWGPYGPDSW
jgi:hypothetical protein